MKKHEPILFDKTELILTYPTKNQFVSVNVNYEKIVRIEIKKYKYRKMIFLKKESERIVFQISGREEPIYISKEIAKERFDDYKARIAEFAKYNRITFVS